MTMSPLAYLIVASMGIVAAVGLRARTGELPVEARALCRAKARWAAESAIARGRAELGAGRMPSSITGVLSSAGDNTDVRYRLDVGRGGGVVVLEAHGACTKSGDRPVRSSIIAELKGGGTRWKVLAWSELPSTESEEEETP
jgi:hypothetical protein